MDGLSGCAESTTTDSASGARPLFVRDRVHTAWHGGQGPGPSVTAWGSPALSCFLLNTCTHMHTLSHTFSYIHVHTHSHTCTGEPLPLTHALTWTCAHTLTYTGTLFHTNILTHTQAHTCTHILSQHTLIHTCTHSSHTQMHAYAHSLMHTFLHTHAFTLSHTRTDTHAHTLTHMCTHSHAYAHTLTNACTQYFLTCTHTLTPLCEHPPPSYLHTLLMVLYTAQSLTCSPLSPQCCPFPRMSPFPTCLPAELPSASSMT